MTEQIRINKVKLGATLAGKPVVHLHAPGAQFSQYPALYLFDASLLIPAGIDPNALTAAPTFVNLWAHYEVSTKKNTEGNYYKDVIALERIDAPSTTTSTDTTAILAELRAIKALLLELATGSAPLVTEKTKRNHALNRAGRTGSHGDEPQTTEPEPELTEKEARTEFYELTGPAVIAGTDPGKINDLITTLANGDGWKAALAGLRELLLSADQAGAK